jgi:glycerol-3-phosphate responsive antiterminator
MMPNGLFTPGCPSSNNNNNNNVVHKLFMKDERVFTTKISTNTKRKQWEVLSLPGVTPGGSRWLTTNILNTIY